MFDRKPQWRHLAMGLALIAVLALSSEAIGGPSLRKLVKKEVAKQIKKATGPAGANGAAGADGTARAYARVNSNCTGGAPQVCPISRTKGVASVQRVATGIYCIDAPGLSALTSTAAVTLDDDTTAPPDGNATVMVRTQANDCTGDQLEVITERQDLVADTVANADDIAFTILIP
jgi:hypothetical protein